MVSIVPPISPIDYTPIDPVEQEPRYESGSNTPLRRGTPTPRIPFTPPVGTDGYVPIELITPYTDPPNSFRATSVEDMFRIVPDVNIYWNGLELEGDTGIASFMFDVGVPSKNRVVIVTIQNRTLSNPLRVNLDIPTYLRCDLGNEFIVPERGNTTTPPVIIQPPITRRPGAIADQDTDRFTTEVLQTISLTERRSLINGQPIPRSDWKGSGKGLINVLLFFSDEQANQLMPGRLTDEIIFRITPLGITGPVFVDVDAPIPQDLNQFIQSNPSGTIPRDDDQPGDPDTPEQPSTIIEYVDREVEVPVPDDTLRWVNGRTGQVEEGYPPDGWYAGADGRMYPPLITDPCSDGSGAFPQPGIDPENLTKLQQLMLKSLAMTPPTFGVDKTKRQGYVIEVDQYYDGIDSSRMIKWVPALVIADSVEDENKFKIIAIPDTARDGTSWTQMPAYGSQAEFVQWLADVAYVVAYLKEGVGLELPTELDWIYKTRRANILRWANKFLNGEVETVQSQLRTPESDRLIVNGGALAAQIIEGIRANGEGELWPTLIDLYQDQLDTYPSVTDAIEGTDNSSTGGTTTTTTTTITPSDPIDSAEDVLRRMYERFFG